MFTKIVFYKILFSILAGMAVFSIHALSQQNQDEKAMKFAQAMKSYQDKDWDKAKDGLEKCMNLFPENSPQRAEIYGCLGMIYLKIARESNNETMCQRALLNLQRANMLKTSFFPAEISPKSYTDTLHNLGVAYRRLGKEKEARECFEKSSQIATTPIFALCLAPIAGEEKALQGSEETTILSYQNNLRFEINFSGYFYAYKRTMTGFVPEDKLSLSPKDFANGKASILLALDGIQESGIWMWYYSPKAVDAQERMEILEQIWEKEAAKENLEYGTGLVAMARKGLEDESQEPKAINCEMRHSLRLFLVSSSLEYRVARIHLLHSPIQVEHILSTGSLLQKEQKLKAGDRFCIKITNHWQKLLYIYGFHRDDAGSLTQLLPRQQTRNCLNPGDTILLPNPNHYYKIDSKSKWECQFFFYREQNVDANVLKQWVQNLSPEQISQMLPDEKQNCMALKNWFEIVPIQPEKAKAPVQSEKMVTEMAQFIAIKFHKEEK